MTARITQGDIAKVAGVHNTTVSLALRHCASIPESTRRRIQAIAAELGYHPDPALRALVAYRRGRAPARPKETLAYVTNGDTRWGWRALPAHERAFTGAQRKAAECGYQLEHFWLGEPGLSQRRLGGMLYHRGISGVMLAAHRPGGDDLTEIDWSRFSAVKIGCFPHAPACHRVVEDHAGMARAALRRILATGAERVGLAMPHTCDELANQGWTAGYLVEQSRLPGDQRVPILRIAGRQENRKAERGAPEGADDFSALAQWRREHRVDVVLGFGAVVLPQLRSLGLRVPHDIGFVDLDRQASDASITGMCAHSDIVGEVAAAMLVGQLEQNTLGLPRVASTTLIEGSWTDGATLLPPRPAERWRNAGQRVDEPIELRAALAV